MERTTKAEVFAAFERLVKAIGGRVAEDYKDVGGYQLNHDRTYGGYNVERIVSNGGGVSHPFGATRRRAREMYDVLYFALQVQEGK